MVVSSAHEVRQVLSQVSNDHPPGRFGWRHEKSYEDFVQVVATTVVQTKSEATDQLVCE